MKYIYLLTLLLISSIGFSQTKGITYQAVILNPIETELPGVNQTNSPLANTDVCLKFGILDQNSDIEYLETIQTTTDKFGMVNLIIGTGSQIGGYASTFSDVAWDNNAKNLQVHLNAKGDCSSYTEISNQPFTYVPFALNALTNTTDIATNASGITTNTTGITTNASNITTNTADIASNASGIALNTAKTGITSSQAAAITNNTAEIASIVNRTDVIIAKLANYDTAIASAGNLEFRYSGNTTGGYLEVRTVSGSMHSQAYCIKRSNGATISGSTTQISMTVAKCP